MSALLVVMSFIFIGTGIGYSLYLDFVVPIFITLIYLRCDLKYTLLASLNVILLVVLGLGNIAAAVWMSQSIVLGILSGALIIRKKSLVDDLFWASILGCLIMLLIDFYFSSLLGFSILDDINLLEGVISVDLKELIFYLSLASLPVGTMIMTYVGALWSGHRLGILSGEAEGKYKMLRHFIKYKSYMHCERITFIVSVVYLLTLDIVHFKPTSAYLRAFILCSQFIALYFVLMDMYQMIIVAVHSLTNSAIKTQLVLFTLLVLLFSNFRLAVYVIIVIGILLDRLLHMRVNHQKIIDSLM